MESDQQETPWQLWNGCDSLTRVTWEIEQAITLPDFDEEFKRVTHETMKRIKRVGCIKTGVNVWLESHGALVHGDLHRIGDDVAGYVYILRACKKSTWKHGADYMHEADARFLTDPWEASRMIEFGGYETIVVMSPYVYLEPHLRTYIGDED